MRSPLLFTPYLLAAAVVASGWLWHLGDIRAGLAPVGSEDGVTIGGPFTLTDQDGQVRHDSDYRGKYMLVFFGYTYCPDVCPTTLAELSAALDKIGGKATRVVTLFVSVDPGRDTPAVLKNYLAPFGHKFIGLTGTPAQIAAVAAAYHVFYKKHPMPDGSYSMDHSSIVYLMGPDGAYVANYSIEQGPDAIAEDLRKRL